MGDSRQGTAVMRVLSSPGGAVSLSLASAEREMLSNLTGEIIALLEEREMDDPGEARDPAITRLLPDAYNDDPEAAAEFRHFTEDDLANAKSNDAAEVASALNKHDPIILDARSIHPWLRTLTDLRLAISVRLGISNDDEQGVVTAESKQARQIYQWLGYLQEYLLDALENTAT